MAGYAGKPARRDAVADGPQLRAHRRAARPARRRGRRPRRRAEPPVRDRPLRRPARLGAARPRPDCRLPRRAGAGRPRPSASRGCPLGAGADPSYVVVPGAPWLGHGRPRCRRGCSRGGGAGSSRATQAGRPEQLEAEVADGAWWVLDALPSVAASAARPKGPVARRPAPPGPAAVTLPATYPSDSGPQLTGKGGVSPRGR